MTDANELRAALAHFIGTEQWHFNPLYRNMRYTDGVKFFAKHAGNGAYWFLDLVGLQIHRELASKAEFLLIKLVSDGHEADIVVEDGNDHVLTKVHVPLTDCPAGEWKFYLVDDVLMLPSEY